MNDDVVIRKGRPPKYPFRTLRVMEAVLIKDAPKNFSEYAGKFGNLYGRKFTTRRVATGTVLVRWA